MDSDRKKTAVDINLVVTKSDKNSKAHTTLNELRYLENKTV